METFLGQIELFAFDYAPVGWALCDGTVMSIQQNSALFALLGSKFGGDGRTTFALPNLLGASPIQGMRYYIATQGYFPPRQ